jgi:hypothetical protein
MGAIAEPMPFILKDMEEKSDLAGAIPEGL